VAYSDGIRHWFCDTRTRRRHPLPYGWVDSNDESTRLFTFAGPLLGYLGHLGSSDNSVDAEVIVVNDTKSQFSDELFTSPTCPPQPDQRSQCGSSSNEHVVKLLLHPSGWAVWSLSRAGFRNAVMTSGPGERTTMLDESDDLRAGSLRFADDGRVTWVSHGVRQYHELP
jgi:hypothetical protein